MDTVIAFFAGLAVLLWLANRIIKLFNNLLDSAAKIPKKFKHCIAAWKKSEHKNNRSSLRH
jgi:phage-related holin